MKRIQSLVWFRLVAVWFGYNRNANTDYLLKHYNRLFIIYDHYKNLFVHIDLLIRDGSINLIIGAM